MAILRGIDIILMIKNKYHDIIISIEGGIYVYT